MVKRCLFHVKNKCSHSGHLLGRQAPVASASCSASRSRGAGSAPVRPASKLIGTGFTGGRGAKNSSSGADGEIRSIALSDPEQYRPWQRPMPARVNFLIDAMLPAPAAAACSNAPSVSDSQRQIVVAAVASSVVNRGPANNAQSASWKCR